MIDYLIRCDTVDEAEALIEKYTPSLAYQARVILQDTEWDFSDEDNPVIVTPEITADGFHIWICLNHFEETLQNLPNNNCRLIADRSLCDEASTFSDVLLYHADDIPPEVLSSARIEPVPSGSNYPFKKG